MITCRYGLILASHFVLVGGIALAGNNNQRFGNQVGGVMVNPDGVLESVGSQNLQELNALRADAFNSPPSALKKPVELRKISLRRIDAALKELGQHKIAELPDEVQYLAGMQRIQFVFLYPEQNDIVIAGPGEGWKLDGKANIVGVTTGRPVLQLEDFVVAFRSVEAARQGQLSCSIDPTAEGRQRFEQLIKTQKTFNASVVPAIEKAFGDQHITISGVPDTSRFARILAAADYKMKRIGMKLEPSPVKGLSSFIDLAPARLDNMMPRWWMACNYEPLGRSEDGLAWELRGAGVKVQTEDEFVDNAKGTVRGSSQASPAAQKWSDQFTAKYDDLSAKEPIFGELRNLMDMCVIAALMTKENLPAKVKCELPELTSKSGRAQLAASVAPKKVPTQCSATKKGTNWVITASGGVNINSWEVADKIESRPALNMVRSEAKPGVAIGAGAGLWWN